MSDLSIKDLVGQRVLLRRFETLPDPVDEYSITEVSPSGTHVKLVTTSGSETWRHVDNVRVSEVLGPAGKSLEDCADEIKDIAENAEPLPKARRR